MLPDKYMTSRTQLTKDGLYKGVGPYEPSIGAYGSWSQVRQQLSKLQSQESESSNEEQGCSRTYSGSTIVRSLVFQSDSLKVVHASLGRVV
jgi:hypothetical protein